MKNKSFDWAIVGAGPAGIAAVGRLLDTGVSAESILWVDPSFTVGDFGHQWRNVSSNTKVRLFQRFLETCSAFAYKECTEKFPLNELDPEATCDLKLAADPLLWVTQRLQDKVQTVKGWVKSLQMLDYHWQIQLQTDEVLSAKNVILAVGAEPKTLHYAANQISLEAALDKTKLAKACQKGESIAVFGSSHSAVIILRYLVELNVKKIINFYLSPLRYAVYLNDDEILFDDTGLKGQTATWARQHLHGHLPENMTRLKATPENVQTYLPSCDHAIYAVGFQRREDIFIDGIDIHRYNNRSGIIAPGLFGFGVAFPQAKTDRFGNVENRVGLWKFMKYLDEVLPVWLKYGL